MNLLTSTLIFIVILLTCTLMVTGRREGYDKNLPILTSVGSTVNEMINFQDHSTVIKKLIGDNGKTILLIHNTPADFQIWVPFYMHVNSLKRRGEKIPTLISWDIIGSGTSWMRTDDKFSDANINNHAWSTKMYISDMLQIYEKFVKSGQVIVAGYGYGAFLAQLFATRYPKLVEHLYICQTILTPNIANIQKDVDFLSAWCLRHTKIDYLTMPTDFVDNLLCIWFDVDECKDIKDNSTEYILTRKLILEASANSLLQTEKLYAATNIKEYWQTVRDPFPVTVIAADRDNFTPMDVVKSNVEMIKPYCKSVKLITVQGKHSFIVKHSDAFYKIMAANF